MVGTLLSGLRDGGPRSGGADGQHGGQIIGAGVQVDPVQMELHGKALAYQREHAGTDYLTAVLAVSAA